MEFICYKRCSTCKGVEQLMQEKGLTYNKRDIKEDNPTAEELKEWHQLANVPIKRFFNTSGKIYHEQQLKDKLPDLSDEECYDLLASNGMLVKRPIILTDDQCFVGPDVKKYIRAL